MNEKITNLLTEVQNLKNANVELKNANVELKNATDDLKKSFENQLAAKSAELGNKSIELEKTISKKVDDAKESLSNDIKDIQDIVNASASDFNVFKRNATATNNALKSYLVATVDDKLKPFAGTEKVIANLKTTYLSDPTIPVYRIGKWFSYNPHISWFDNDDPNMYGGVRPSQWSDGNGRADQMTNDWKSLKALFTKKETADKYGANVCSEAYGQYTSTTGLTCGVIFRIKNTDTRTIRWSPAVTMTSYHGWSETTSISVNGNTLVNQDCSNECRFTPSVDIPPNSAGNRTSTVIFISTGSYNYGHYAQWRATILLFRDNSLQLPRGLEYVDDMDVLSGPWKM